MRAFSALDDACVCASSALESPSAHRKDGTEKFVFTRIGRSSFHADDADEAEKAEGSVTTNARLVEKELTSEIIGSFYTVYNAFGYGFLESPYANALSLELQARGLQVQREVPVELRYEGTTVGFYRMDMVVEGRVLIENKASAAIAEADCRQLFNYLRASNLTVGLLLHFGPKPAHRRFIWTGKQFNSQS